MPFGQSGSAASRNVDQENVGKGGLAIAFAVALVFHQPRHVGNLFVYFIPPLAIHKISHQPALKQTGDTNE